MFFKITVFAVDEVLAQDTSADAKHVYMARVNALIPLRCSVRWFAF